MKWNKLDVELNFDAFWENYYLIQIASAKDNDKYFDVADFQSWLLVTNDKIYCPILSILFEKIGDMHYTWGLVCKKDRQKLQELSFAKGIEKFIIRPIYFHERFCDLVNNEREQKRILVQLFLNYVEKDALWSNLSGRCFVNINKELNVNPNENQVFLEFRLNKNLFLSISVRTYSKSSLAKKKKILKRPPYIIDVERDHRLRRAFAGYDDMSDENTFRFFSSSYEKKKEKNIFPFLRLDKKYSCKLKYLTHLLDRLKNSSFVKIGILHFSFEDIKGNIKNLLGKSDTISLNFDGVKNFQLWVDSDCEEAVGFFEKYNRKKEYTMNVVYDEGKLVPNRPTIMVIHTKKKYEDNKRDDKYTDSPVLNYPIQHLQFDTITKMDKPNTKGDTIGAVIDKCIQELAIKTCIFNEQLAVNINSNQPFPEITFCLPYEEVYTQMIGGEEKKNSVVKMYSCRLNNNGKMIYNSFDRYIPGNEKLFSLYDKYNKSTQWEGVAKLSCFCWFNDSPDIVYSILEIQDAFLMPEYEKISYYISKSAKRKEAVNKKFIIAMYKSFFKDYNVLSNKANVFIERIEKMDGVDVCFNDIKIKKTELGVNDTDLFIWSTSDSNPYHNVPTMVPWRDKEIYPFFGMPLKIGYTKAHLPFDSLDSHPCIIYYSGYRPAMNLSSHFKACKFRALISDDTDDYSIWESLYPLMDVDFATRIYSFSVLPFPIKLLHEYILMNTRCSEHKQLELFFNDSGLE